MAKSPNTTNTQIKRALGKLFLYSRERKRCLHKGAVCSAEGCSSQVKLEAHHTRRVNWQRIYAVIREELLNDHMVPMCKECHAKTYDQFGRKPDEN